MLGKQDVTNNTTTNQQLHIISHNSSKGEKIIQHLEIIHTSSYNYIKLFQKYLQGNRA